MSPFVHLVSYRDGTTFAYGGVHGTSYGDRQLTLLGDYVVVVVDYSLIAGISILRSAEEYPNGWSHDPHVVRVP